MSEDDDITDHSVLEEFDEVTNEIVVKKLKLEIKDLKAHVSHISLLVDDVRDFTGLSTERIELIRDTLSSYSTLASSDDIRNLEREIRSLEVRRGENNYIVIRNGRKQERIHIGRREIQKAMAKCRGLEKLVGGRRKELSYSFKLPPDLEAIKAHIKTRKKHFQQLEDKIDARLAHNNKLDSSQKTMQHKE